MSLPVEIAIGLYLVVGFGCGIVLLALSFDSRVPRWLAFLITLVLWPWVLWTLVRSGGD